MELQDAGIVWGRREGTDGANGWRKREGMTRTKGQRGRDGITGVNVGEEGKDRREKPEKKKREDGRE